MEDNGKSLEQQVNEMVDKQVVDALRHGIHADTVLMLNNVFRSYCLTIHQMKAADTDSGTTREALVSVLSNIIVDFTTQMIGRHRRVDARDFARFILEDMVPIVSAGIQANYSEPLKPKLVLDS